MSFFYRSKPTKKAEEEAPVEKSTQYVVLINVEKDLLINAKKTVSVPVIIPAVPDLELTWEISVLRADIGVSASFMPDEQAGESSQEAIVEAPKLKEPKGRTKESPCKDPVSPNEPEVAEKRRFGWMRKKSSSNVTAPDEDDDDFDAAPAERPTGRVCPVLEYERVTRNDGIDGSYRFNGAGGKILFILDNSYSSMRRKRVLIKLVVESIGAEAQTKEEQAEKKQLDRLRAEVLKAVPDNCGYLVNDLTVKRFLEARPTFDASAAMLINHIRWRNEGRFLRGCQLCPTLPGTHVWRQIGFDNERRPAIFFSISQVLNKVERFVW